MEQKRQVVTSQYAIYQGDCVELMRQIPDRSIGLSVFSPPFSSLYTYSNSERDMGNCRSDEDFARHFQFLVKELYRSLINGRLVAIHCMNLPASKQHDGYIGIKDFRGDLIRLFQSEGFIYHSEVCIWKDPVTAMQRTKAIGLLHKQLMKDSALSRQGIPDYLVVMRKPGANENPIAGRLSIDEFAGDNPPSRSGDKTRESIDMWQRYASPVWMDINPSNTLQYQTARDQSDERHICPLQLDVVDRAIQLWSNPGDVVLTPFLGIGTEVYQAIKRDRRGVGFELKPSYFELAKQNCAKAYELATHSDTPLLELLGGVA